MNKKTLKEEKYEHITHPFPPLYDANSKILILGSLPSVKSREQMFFYGHPQNRFWRMLAAVYAEDAPESIAEKTSLLLRHHLALWDVIANCEIDGSADASVREAVPVDIVRITDRAHITRVLCNGKLAGTLYARHLQPIMGIPALVLPSTSPANAIWTLPKLTDAWRKALTGENATFCE